MDGKGECVCRAWGRGLSAGSEPSEEYLASEVNFGLTNGLSRKNHRVPGFPHGEGEHIQNQNERNTKH